MKTQNKKEPGIFIQNSSIRGIFEENIQKERKKIASEQTMTQATAQEVIEATETVIMAVREAENPVYNSRTTQPTPRIRGPMLNCQHLTGNHHKVN